MIPWVLLDTSSVPGGREPLRLLRRGDEFSIRLGQNELMNSRLSGSEEALATLTCGPLAGRPEARVLIGGLGMGFTLRAALKILPGDARVTVSELVPAVVAWGRGPMASLFEHCLDDRRVRVEERDVAEVMATNGPQDAILLDVDNGPEGLTRAQNDRLYDRSGLARAFAALREGGVLAVWSSAPDDRFTKRVSGAGFVVEQVRVKANAGRSGARHTIWLARRGPRRTS